MVLAAMGVVGTVVLAGVVTDSDGGVATVVVMEIVAVVVLGTVVVVGVV